MKRDEIAQLFLSKIIDQGWHWLNYHIAPCRAGYEHFLTASIFDSCLEIEQRIPGYSNEFTDKLASISGREKYIPHFEQIIQLLAELYVTRHLVSVSFEDPKFILEPTVVGSAKNPEIGIYLSDDEIFVEVKCRQFIEHHNNRGEAAIEIPYRQSGILDLAKAAKENTESIVLPRDNVIKDFLISADQKFEAFKKQNIDCITVLIIVWDDFIYEPISALLNKKSGLLTQESFYRDGEVAYRFPNIDAILTVRQSHQIVRAMRDDLPVDGLRHPLDWGEPEKVLPKALIPVNSSDALNDYLCDVFQAKHISELQTSAEYRVQDFILNV